MSGKSVIVEYDDFMKWFVPEPLDEEEPTCQLEALDFSQVATKPKANMYKYLVNSSHLLSCALLTHSYIRSCWYVLYSPHGTARSDGVMEIPPLHTELIVSSYVMPES